MIIRKKYLYITIVSLILLVFTTGFGIGGLLQTKITEYIFHNVRESFTSTVRAAEPDLPLPIPSIITTEVENIRLDLEKVSVNKFFIVYSEIYGNQSHTAYHLYLTDLDRKDLDKEALSEIYLRTSEGEIIKPVAQVPVIEDFPVDQPLSWKIKIIVKFPYKTQRPVHELVLTYKNQEYILTGIYY
ncbi:MAG: hypothetical protein ACLFUI_01970 [Halanaerobiales bacterium]